MEKVIWVKSNNSAIVLFNNPPVNIIDKEVLLQLSTILEEINEDNECRAVIFAALNDKVFLVGADIKELQKWVKKGRYYGELKSHEFQIVLNQIANMIIPTIVAINGMTLGGGCELALCCDIRIMEGQAKIGMPEIKLGVVPGAGGTQRLPRIIGDAKAKELMFTGKLLNGKQAEKIGLVNELVPKGTALEKALEFAENISNYSFSVLALMKKSLNEGQTTSIREGLQIEAKYFGEAFRTQDVKEGINSFLQKRESRFINR